MSADSAFDVLLARLDSDRNRAGERYEMLRRKLEKYFDWRQQPADVLADETLDRVSNRLARGLEITSIEAFCLATARRIASEYQRSPEGRRVAVDQLSNRPDPQGTPESLLEHAELARERRQLARLLERLPADVRAIIAAYYDGSGRARIDRRRELAARHGLTLNALRIMVCRVRTSLNERVQATPASHRQGTR